MTDINEFPLNGDHLGIVGTTGDGKTYWASRRHNNASNPSIFFNYKSKKRDNYDVEGVRIDGSEDEKVIKGLLKADKRVKVNGKIYDVDYKGQKLVFNCHYKHKNEQLHALYNLLVDVADELPKDVFIDVYVEEAKELDDALDRLLEDGRGNGIRGIPITQRPKHVGTDGASQIKEWVVMSVSDNQSTWFKQNNLPFDRIYQATNSGEADNYHWAHVYGRDVNTYEPLPAP